MRGLRMEDMERMTLGMWVDYIIEWNNVHLAADKPAKRKATQADYDAF